MGFSKHLYFYKIPEWSDDYFDYEAVKQDLYALDVKKRERRRLKRKSRLIFEAKAIPLEEEVKLFSEEDQLSSGSGRKKFFEGYERELRRNGAFFSKKLKEYNEEFEQLETKITARNMMMRRESEESEDIKRTNIKVNAERDEFGYAVSWKRAMSHLFNLTSWLYSYSTINSISRKKIGKKAEVIDLSLKVRVDQIDLDLVKEEEMNLGINALRAKIKDLYAEEFTGKDKKRAFAELDQRLKGNRTKHTKLISFYLGIILATIGFLIISIITNRFDIRNVIPYFPAFSFTFVITFVLLGVGGNIVVLRKFQINYLYILEVEPKKRLGAIEMFQNSLLVLMIWILLFTLMVVIPNSFAVFALIAVTALFTFFFFPFHWAYYAFRKGILLTLFLNFFPIGINAVRFKDFLFGDILTSLNKPFANLVLSFCLFGCTSCRINNKRSPECTRNTVPCLIFLFGPFLIRFFQCINRYYYTKKAWPHLGNTLKYVGGMTNAICAWLYENHKDKEDWKLFLIIHVSVGIVATSYMLFWDIKMDWSLGECQYSFLRKKLIYPKSWYYAVISINACLRFTWALNLYNLDKGNKYNDLFNEGRNFVFGVLEAYRRVQWCIFRIENESINNPDEYRDVLEIPALVD